MPAVRRRIAVAGLFLLCVTHGGCASAGTQSAESGRDVQGQPPEEEPPDRMPKGPPVEVEGSESEQQTSDGPDRNRRVNSSPEGERTYVTESRVQTLLEHGPQYLFQVVAVESVKADGEFRGYRIVDAGSGALEVMNPQLQIGDVVTEINGVPIERPDDYLAAWKKLKHRAVLEVKYRREGDSDRALWYVRERVEAKRSGEESRGGGD